MQWPWLSRLIQQSVGFRWDVFSFGNDAALEVRIDEARKLVKKAIDVG
jgi:hypothetical protein